MLHKFHKFSFIALVEPFKNLNQINRYKKILKMPTVSANCSGLIWFFANHDIDITVISYTEQQLTIKLAEANQSHNFFCLLWFMLNEM